MKKILAIIFTLISISSFSQGTITDFIESMEYVNTDSFKLAGDYLYLKHLVLKSENNGKIAKQQGDSVIWGEATVTTNTTLTGNGTISNPLKVDTTIIVTKSDLITELAIKENILTKGDLIAGSAKVTISGTGISALIGTGASVDVNEANLNLSNIGGAVTDGQVPNTITLDNITQITNRSHTSLTDKGTNTHTQIDAHIINDGDLSCMNEIQDLSRAGNTLSLSGDATTVDLSDLVNPDLTGYRLKTDHDSLQNLDEKSYNSLTDKPTSLPASDVYPWAKAATKPTYTYSEVGAQKPITLTTTGTSGAATFDGETLNIPQYTGGTSISGIWTSISTGAYASATTFTFTGTDTDAKLVELSLLTCTNSTGATRRIGYVKTATNSSGTITCNVVTDTDLASGDKDFKVAYNRKITDYKYPVTIPGECIADASYSQGMYYYINAASYLLPIDIIVRTPAAGTGASCTTQVYKRATTLFSSAPDLTTNSTLLSQRPTTNTISAGDVVSIRIPASAGATNKAADYQAWLWIVPQTLFTAF